MGARRKGTSLLAAAFLSALCFTAVAEDSEPKAALSGGDHCYIFSHLQKSGGSTVKEILKNGFKKKAVIYDTQRWESGKRTTQEFADDLVTPGGFKVVSGGYTPALMSFGTDACKWFTVFRHPVHRLVSAYFYCKKRSADPICASGVFLAKNVGLLTFAKLWGNFALRQFVLTAVSADDVMKFGKANIPDFRAVQRSGWYLQKLYMEEHFTGDSEEPDAVLYQYLESVEEMLQTSYAAVGILEDFNTTLHLFNHALLMPEVDWPAAYAVSGLKNKDSVFHDEETAALEEAWTSTEIKRYMRLDLLLYEHAVDIFHEQARHYGLSPSSL